MQLAGAGATFVRSTSMAGIAGAGSGVLMGVGAATTGAGAVGAAAVKAGAGPAAEGKTARCMLTGHPLGITAPGAAATGTAAQAGAGVNPAPTNGIGLCPIAAIRGRGAGAGRLKADVGAARDKPLAWAGPCCVLSSAVSAGWWEWATKASPDDARQAGGGRLRLPPPGALSDSTAANV